MFDLASRILVVDDMLTMRKLVIKACKEVGFGDFVEASNGADAWEALTNASPPISIIISDWNMPNSTGIDLLKRVRGDKRYGQLPFLLVTAEAEVTQVQEAAAAGVTEYLVKPFSKDSLADRLRLAYKKTARS